MTDRNKNVSMDTITLPKYNYPSSVAIQLGLHHNDASLSPHRNGVELLGGKQYQLTLKQEKKHLLPFPYQTNCTDYKKAWAERGGVGPLNAIMAVEECKYNYSLQEFGCVPFSVDYPHNDSICKLPDPFTQMGSIGKSYGDLQGSETRKVAVKLTNVERSTAIKRLGNTGLEDRLIIQHSRVEPTAPLVAVLTQAVPLLRAPMSSRTIARRLAEGHLVSRCPLSLLPMRPIYRLLRFE
ncbi:uncharacterized protein TNCV_2843651 [Trichonephila clavipes]|nr:uncharacterized protein TNCV_2843651 [Trichonephila clavipes]